MHAHNDIDTALAQFNEEVIQALKCFTNEDLLDLINNSTIQMLEAFDSSSCDSSAASENQTLPPINNYVDAINENIHPIPIPANSSEKKENGNRKLSRKRWQMEVAPRIEIPTQEVFQNKKNTEKKQKKKKSNSATFFSIQHNEVNIASQTLSSTPVAFETAEQVAIHEENSSCLDKQREAPAFDFLNFFPVESLPQVGMLRGESIPSIFQENTKTI